MAMPIRLCKVFRRAGAVPTVALRIPATSAKTVGQKDRRALRKKAGVTLDMVDATVYQQSSFKERT